MFLWVSTAGVVSYYRDFVEFMYELLDGNASITGKDYEPNIVRWSVMYFIWLIASFFMTRTSYWSHWPYEKGGKLLSVFKTFCCIFRFALASHSSIIILNISIPLWNLQNWPTLYLRPADYMLLDYRILWKYILTSFLWR